MCAGGQEAYDYLLAQEKKGLTPEEIYVKAFRSHSNYLQYLRLTRTPVGLGAPYNVTLAVEALGEVLEASAVAKPVKAAVKKEIARLSAPPKGFRLLPPAKGSSYIRVVQK
jgi:hypothetical protein